LILSSKNNIYGTHTYNQLDISWHDTFNIVHNNISWIYLSSLSTIKKVSKMLTTNSTDRSMLFGDFYVFPDEIMMKILSYLSIDDLRNLSLVNSLWRKYSEDDFIWKPIYIDTFGQDFISNSNTPEWKVQYYKRKKNPLNNVWYIMIKNMDLFVSLSL